ncbi:hypothetical protein [Klebsiella pneumoniae]|uniref:hypothetical protein n=1 Tax=Klebsiella pneumoniae TaxID=573 RepID=UPI0034D2D179
MTDITELAQSLKAAADREMICRDVSETSEIWERTVTPENILALVEALEKAQQRIAELEEAEQKLCAANVTLDARAELAERQRIAELESRTVSVKLPTTRLWAGVTECYEKSDVIAAIRSAGMEASDD